MQTDERRSKVHEWQRYYGMEPRSDSTLTDQYAAGKFDAPPDAVARELMATHFIYQQTLYGEVIEEFMRSVANRLHREHAGLSWTQTWEIVKFYAPIGLKLLCLERSGLAIPPRLS